MRYLLLSLSILFASIGYAQNQQANTLAAKASVENITQQFQKVDLDAFIKANKLPSKMVEAKQRLMLKPRPIQFSAAMMQAPTAGKFTLVYDSLMLWPSDQPLPEISHSAFLGTANDKVIGVYAAKAAATQMQLLFDQANSTTPIQLHFYAMHIYNYAQGPRLVIIGATVAAHE